MANGIVKANPLEVERYNPTVHRFEDLQAEADTTLGYELAAEDLADYLVGVPHILTGVNYRRGVLKQLPGEKEPKQFAYVSCEALTYPRYNLAKINAARKACKLPEIASLEDLPFEPESLVVYNDGSTGIYRQITAYLNDKGIIDLVGPDGEITRAGRSGLTTYDLPPGDWFAVNAGELHFDETGFGLYRAEIRLDIRRGLRISKYQNEWTNNEDSTTRYLG